MTFFRGLRIGEALALRREDVLIDGDKVSGHVHTTMYRKIGEGMVYQDGAKTNADNRKVPVFAHCQPLVHEHLAKWVGNDPKAFLFTTDKGKVLMDTSYRSRLKTAKDKVGVKGKLSPHYGRLWLITTLVEAGMTIPTIGEILGQRDLKTITEVYMRTSEAKKQEFLAKVDGVFK